MNPEAQARAAPADRPAQGLGSASSMSADERVETIDSLAAAAADVVARRATPRTFGCDSSTCPTFIHFAANFPRPTVTAFDFVVQPTRWRREIGSPTLFFSSFWPVDFDVSQWSGPVSITPISSIANECHAPQQGNGAPCFPFLRPI
jgi:hypothetical protein